MQAFCPSCGLPSDTKGFAWEASGTCSYCDFFPAIRETLFNYSSTRELFLQRLACNRNSTRSYDALVGISGGKDGAYVLYRLVRDYGLNVLAITMDNGFLSDIAKKCVAELTQKLGVDHRFCGPSSMKTFYRATTIASGLPCQTCAIGGYYLAQKLCADLHIPIFIHGRSPFQMFRTLNERSVKNDLYLNLITSNLEPPNQNILRDSYSKSKALFRGLLDNTTLGVSEKELIISDFFDIDLSKTKIMPESFAYFLLEPYNESDIRATLKRELDFEAPSNHADCNIHDLAGPLYHRHSGVALEVLEIATTARFGLISATEAHDQIMAANAKNGELNAAANEQLTLLANHIGVSEEEIWKRKPAFPG